MGVRCFLPLLVWSDLRLDHQGNVRLQLTREGIPLIRRRRTALMANTDREYRIDSYYILSKFVALFRQLRQRPRLGRGPALYLLARQFGLIGRPAPAPSR